MYSTILAKKRDRILAFLVDNVIFTLIFVIMCYVFGNPSENGFELNGAPAFMMMLIGLFLWPFSEAFSVQTIGKRLVGIKVVNESFKDIKTWQAFIRFFFGFIDFSCFFIGLIIASTNEKNQRLGDLVAKTIVVDVNRNKNDQNPA